jgi:hypothetical protein
MSDEIDVLLEWWMNPSEVLAELTASASYFGERDSYIYRHLEGFSFIFHRALPKRIFGVFKFQGQNKSELHKRQAFN